MDQHIEIHQCTTQHINEQRGKKLHNYLKQYRKSTLQNVTPFQIKNNKLGIEENHLFNDKSNI